MGQSPMAMLWYGVAVEPESEDFGAFMRRAKAYIPTEDQDEDEDADEEVSSAYVAGELLQALTYTREGEKALYPNVEVITVSDYCIAIGLRDTRESTDWDVRDLGQALDTPAPRDVAPLQRFIKLLWPDGDGPEPSWKLAGDYS